MTEWRAYLRDVGRQRDPAHQFLWREAKGGIIWDGRIARKQRPGFCLPRNLGKAAARVRMSRGALSAETSFIGGAENNVRFGKNAGFSKDRGASLFYIPAKSLQCGLTAYRQLSRQEVRNLEAVSSLCCGH